MPSEDILADSESSNVSVHEMDALDQVSDLDLHIDIERDKLIVNENLHQPVSSSLHVLKEDTSDPCSLLEGSTTMRSDQLGNSACESSPVNSSAEEVPAPSIDSVDYMDIDTEAGREVDSQNVQQQAVSGDSVRVMGVKTSAPISESCIMAGKPKPLFSLGFLDKPSRKKSHLEESQNRPDMDVSSQKVNGHRNEHLSRSEQGVIANSSGGQTSYANGSVHSNGDIFVNSSNRILANGDTQFANHCLDASKRDVPSFRGFNPRPHTSPSSSNINRNNTSNGKGDMSFLSRGFLERPRSREKAVKGNDGLPFSSRNGKPSPSSMNGSSISNTNSSSQSSQGGMGMSPGFLTKGCRESAGMGASASCMGVTQASNTSKEQEHVGSAALPDQIQERWSSDCTTSGIARQHRAAFADNVNGHRDENGHSVLGTKDAIYGEENGSNGTLHVHGSSCQMDDYVNGHSDENGHAVLGTKNVLFVEENGSNGALDASSCQIDGVPVTLVSENGMGSEDGDHVVKSTRDNHKEIDDLKCHLAQEFEVKDLGHLRYFLGIEVSRGPQGNDHVPTQCPIYAIVEQRKQEGSKYAKNVDDKGKGPLIPPNKTTQFKGSKKPKKPKQDMSLVQSRKCKEMGHNPSGCPENPKNKEIGQVVCNNCKELGHYVAICSQEQRKELQDIHCFNCKEPGHYVSNCPEKMKNKINKPMKDLNLGP
uniref:Uncharacterized protein n=1 Tax=Avena sativa TaxID=4498 RepID=A0ACD6AJF1_AVESA